METDIFDNPKLLTLSATVIGFLLIGDLTAYQQNALGNWFMTIGQILEANSAFVQAIQSKYQSNNNFSIPTNNKEDILKVIEYLEERLKNIKKEIIN